MSRVTELEKALTTLFRKGTEVGYTETEIDEFLENIDYQEEKVYLRRIILLPVKCFVQIVEQKCIITEMRREYGKKIILRQGR